MLEQPIHTPVIVYDKAVINRPVENNVPILSSIFLRKGEFILDTQTSMRNGKAVPAK